MVSTTALTAPGFETAAIAAVTLSAVAVRQIQNTA